MTDEFTIYRKFCVSEEEKCTNFVVNLGDSMHGCERNPVSKIAIALGAAEKVTKRVTKNKILAQLPSVIFRVYSQAWELKIAQREFERLVPRKLE
tara:strand:- start:360 stop:644 length:285 start_codon:yes stop_codon:yes gene_type:complete